MSVTIRRGYDNYGVSARPGGGKRLRLSGAVTRNDAPESEEA